MAPSPASTPSLSRDSLLRQSSAIRTGCANERPSGSARGVPRKRCPYRDLTENFCASRKTAPPQKEARRVNGSRKNLVYLIPRVLTPRGLQIPHGAFHVRVPQPLLHGAQIHARPQTFRCKRGPEFVQPKVIGV